MKSQCLLIALVVFSLAKAQELTVRESLLQSKGNIKLSGLFDEPPVLPVNDLDAEIYRMTIIPTFFNPIKIRVEKHKTEYILVAKRLSGQGGYEVGTLKTEKRRRLKPAEWQHLIALLTQAGFWEMSYADKKREPNEKGEVEICLDGSEWVLEGVRQGIFHAVNRYCPDEKSFQAIGTYLAKISGLGVKERELY